MRSIDSMTRRVIVLVSFAAILSSWPTSSFAQPQSSALSKGEPAPFDCICTEPETQRLLTETASQCAERTAAEVSKAARLVQIDVDKCETELEIEKEARAAERRLMELRVESAVAWYREPLFVASVTAVLTASAIVLARETIIERR